MRKKSRSERELQARCPGIAVNVNGDLGYALRLWKRQVKDSGILKRYAEAQYFEKSSVTKRREKLAAIYRNKMEQIK